MLGSTIQSELIDWIRGNAFPAAPSAVYISLHTADPGATGASEHGATAGYAREVATFDAAGDLAAEIEFAEATANYSAAITHFGLWDASSGGGFIVGGPLAASATISDGEVPRLAAGAVSLELNKTT
jgi:hypothetical protein